MSTICSLGFCFIYFFFFSSRRRHTRYIGDWSSDVCSSDLKFRAAGVTVASIGRAPASAALAAEFTAPHVLLSSVDLTSIEEAGKAITAVAARSEERRVGKEWRAGWAREHKKKKKENEE